MSVTDLNFRPLVPYHIRASRSSGMNQEKLYPLALTSFTASANLGTGVHGPPQPSQYWAGFERDFIRESIDLSTTYESSLQDSCDASFK